MNATFFSLIVVASTVINISTEVPKSEQDFIFLKEEKNIILSCRELKLPNNHTTRELKAEFKVFASAETILKVLKNEQYALRWMKGVKEFSTICKINDNDWYAYVQYRIPWPLSNQDCIIRYKCKTTENGHGYILNLNGAPEYLPTKPGVERISQMSGCWKITENVLNRCSVVYTVYSDQKPKYPKWATDPIIQQNLISTLSSMKELAENFQ
jgi:hypothetical protein